MSDNSNSSGGTGDAIRTIDKTAYTGAKTPVTLLDIGGGDGTGESLVTAANPIPVSDKNNAAATTSDGPLYEVLTGDPNGDYAGVPILDMILDASSGEGLNVRQIGGPPIGPDGAQIAGNPPVQTFIYSNVGAIPINAQLMRIDCSQFRSLSIQPQLGASGSLYIFWSNDGNPATATQGQGYTVPGVSSSTLMVGIFTTPVYGRYLHLKLGSAVTSGITAITAIGFSQVIGAVPIVGGSNTNLTSIPVGQATATNLNTAAQLYVGTNAVAGYRIPSGTTSLMGANTLTGASGAACNPTEVSGAARGATSISNGILDAGGGAISAVVVVSAVSGTTPTLDLVLQESYDLGTTWVDVYHCERLTANGTLIVPPVPIQGQRQWSWNITGTTPSFTFAVATSRAGAHPYPRYVNFFDRTANLLNGTAATGGVAFQVAGCSQITGTLTCGTVTTGGTYILQGSNDNGQNWFALTTTAVTAVASSTIVIQSDPGKTCRHARLYCVAGGTAQVGTVANITGVGAS